MDEECEKEEEEDNLGTHGSSEYEMRVENSPLL